MGPRGLYDQKGPLDLRTILPAFSYHPHSVWVQLIFAAIVGLIMGGFLFLGYILLV